MKPEPLKGKWIIKKGVLYMKYGAKYDKEKLCSVETRELFDERDKREIDVGLSGSIASADETISNSNLTKEELIEKAYKTIQSWI